MIRRVLSLALSLLTLAACSHSQLKVQGEARDAFFDLRYSDAEKALQDPKVLGDSKNRLLTLLDLGTVAHYEGNFEKSNIYFFKAKDVFRELYTSSMREALATGILNDNSASYTGMEYEISLLHYYIVVNFLALGQAKDLPAWKQPPLLVDGAPVMPEFSGAARALSDNDRRNYLVQARAELLDWNSFLDEVRESNRGEPYYKDDLLNKVFAAYVHRMAGLSQDGNVSKTLYRDAREMLVRAYAAYPTFNDAHNNYVDNYKKFPDLGVDIVKQRFIRPTAAYAATENAIGEDEKKNSNALLLLEYAEIPRREEKYFVIGLSTLMSQIQDPVLRSQIEQVGYRAILELAPAFGLTVVAATVVGAATDKGPNGDGPHQMSDALDSAIGFEFKLPKIANYPATEAIEVRIHPAAGGPDLALPVSVLSPLGDIARLNVERRASAVALKTGVRVGVKYLAALLPAIITYRKMEGKPEFLRMLAASAIWIAGKKAVDATESADLRSWEYIPRWIGEVEAKLPPGNYGITIVRKENGKDVTVPAGSLTVPPDGKLGFMKVRVFSSGKTVISL